MTKKGKSVAEIVRDLLASNPSVNDALKMGIANYSSLARKIYPTVKRKLGKSVNKETIIVAIRRYAQTLGKETLSKDIVQTLGNSTLSLKSDIAYLTLNRTDPKIFTTLQKLYEKIDWSKGEIMYIVQGISEIMVVLDNKNVDKLLKLFPKKSLLKRFHDMAIIVMKSPIDAAYVPGFIHFLTEKLAEKGINIELISTPCETHILVSEEDATQTYEILKRLVDISRKQSN